MILLAALTLALTSCVLPTQAVDLEGQLWEQMGTSALEDAAEGTFSVKEGTNLQKGLGVLASQASEQVDAVLHSAFRSAGFMLLVVLFCGVGSTLFQSGQSAMTRTADLIGVTVITLVAVSDTASMLGLGREAIDQIDAFSKVLIPTMATATAACGSVTASTTVTVLAIPTEATTGGTVSSGTTSANSGQVITVTPSYVVLKPGATRTLSAKATPASASQSFTYKSGNSSVATVSPSGVITAVGTGSTSITVSNGKATALVTVIVNRSASASSGSDSSNGDDAANGDDDKITLDPTVQTIQDSTDHEVVFAQSEVPVITGDILNSLRTTGKTLCVVGDGYTLQVSGKDVRNTTGELNTSLELQQVEQGLEFVVNDGKTVPCSARIDLDKSDYSRLYLYNETTGKWQYLNSYKDGVITLDTAGRYLLTNENLRFANINWTFFIAGGAVLVVIAVAYIAFKKRYWFW